VRLDGVRAGPVPRLAPPEGFETLAQAGAVPLIGRWREGQAEIVYVGIDPARSRWHLSPSFPIFWANVVDWAGGGATQWASSGLLDAGETMSVGEEVPLPEGLAGRVAARTRTAVSRRLAGWLALAGLLLVVAHGVVSARARGIWA
jgi:hypothetical protein